jgi:DNA-binding MltR family transcriptional regulator
MPEKPFSETHPHLQEFMVFLDKLKAESDRGMVLISTGYIEEQLKKILLAYFVDDPALRSLVEGGSAPLGAFSARITTSYALGLISKAEHDDLHILRRIRNDFAHNIHASFETQSIMDRCKLLQSKAHDYTSVELGEVIVAPSGQFNTAATGLILTFVNRPHYVAKQRKIHKEWPY